MTTIKRQVGNRGESLAAEYLENKGFSIISRNYWRKWGEIDLVARKGRDLRFVEVKTVTRESLLSLSDNYEPEDNLHPWKRKRLRRVIETYLLSEKVSDDWDWQVDAIVVYLDKEGRLLRLEQLEDIVI